MGVPYWKRSPADKVRYIASEIEAGEEVHPDTLEELAIEIERMERRLYRQADFIDWQFEDDVAAAWHDYDVAQGHVEETC